MKKSNIILLIIVSLSVLSLIAIVVEVRMEIDNWLVEDENATVKEVFSSDINTLVVSGDVKVTLKPKESGNWLLHHNSVDFSQSQDSLYLTLKPRNKNSNSKDDVTVNVGKATIQYEEDEETKIKIGLESISAIELNHKTNLKIKEDIELENFSVQTYTSSMFKSEYIKAKNVYLLSSDKTKIIVEGLECDSLFIEARDKSEVVIRKEKDGKIKYISLEAKDKARVRVPSSENIHSTVDENAKLKIL